MTSALYEFGGSGQLADNDAPNQQDGTRARGRGRADTTAICVCAIWGGTLATEYVCSYQHRGAMQGAFGSPQNREGYHEMGAGGAKQPCRCSEEAPGGEGKAGLGANMEQTWVGVQGVVDARWLEDSELPQCQSVGVTCVQRLLREDRGKTDDT